MNSKQIHINAPGVVPLVLTCDPTIVVTGLNADLLDGNHVDDLKEHNYELTVKTGDSITAEDVVRLVNGEISSIPFTGDFSGVSNGCLFGEGDSVNYQVTNPVVAVLSDNTAVCVWRNAQASRYPQICALKFNGTEIVAGRHKNLYASYSFYVAVTALSETSGVAAVYDSTGIALRVIAFTVSGLFVTVGSAYTPNNNSCFYISIDGLTPTTAIIAYSDTVTSSLKAIVVTITGTVVTALSNELVIYGTGVTGTDIAMLTDSKAIVTYWDSTSSIIYSKILSLSGAVLSAGAQFTVVSGSGISESRITSLTTDKAMASWRVSGSLQYSARLLDISGTTITGNATATSESGVIYTDSDLISLTKNKAVLIFKTSATDFLRGFVITVSGTVCSFSNTTELMGEAWALKDSEIGIAAFSRDRIIAVSGTTGEPGVAAIISIQDDFKNVFAIAKETQTGGNDCEVEDLDKSRMVNGLTGLTPGSKYYLDTDGTLITGSITPPRPSIGIYNVDYLIGIAETTTSLRILNKDLGGIK